MRNNIIAIMYDFDKTLCTKDMQEYTFIPNLGIDAKSFWEEANNLRTNFKMDQGSEIDSSPKLMKRCSTLLANREVPVKSTIR